jgi:hypothetical protein
MAGLEPARAFYGPTDFKSVASAISPHRLFSFLKAVLPMRIGPFCSFLLYHDSWRKIIRSLQLGQFTVIPAPDSSAARC